MKKICFTLDDVIRAKTKKVGELYKKNYDSSFDLENLDVFTDELSKVFPFKTRDGYKKFVYTDYAFEIFGEGGVTSPLLDKNLNLWLIKIHNDEDLCDKFSFMLASPYEFNLTIGFTYFFLSTIATRIREVYMPDHCLDIWDRCDVLVTASPELLKNKPEGKIAVKINTPYNKDIPATFTYDSLQALLDDEEFLKGL